MDSIKYIGFYDIHDSKYKRNGSLAAINKMNYIANSISKLGIKVNIISPSWIVENKNIIARKEYIKIKDNINLMNIPSFGAKSRILRYIRTKISSIYLFMYLLKNVKKEEEIIVYHSLALLRPVLYAKNIKKFKVILEVEEIYTDVVNKKKKVRDLEFKMIKSAEKYIFSTEILNETLNLKNKPYSIIYGTYQVEKDMECKFDDDKIHVVYAGTFDPRKGGAAAAAAVAEYLDEKYHIHIIGFGSEDEKIGLQNLIKEVSKKTKCTVTYDGLYKGEEYIKFLQKCDIGLSTQTPNAQYNDTSFPSKVLSYMANGLRVVSIRIKALEKSKISDLLYYYENDSPQEIANAIKSIDLLQPYNSRNKIQDLDKKFIKDIKELLEK